MDSGVKGGVEAGGGGTEQTPAFWSRSGVPVQFGPGSGECGPFPQGDLLYFHLLSSQTAMVAPYAAPFT